MIHMSMPSRVISGRSSVSKRFLIQGLTSVLLAMREHALRRIGIRDRLRVAGERGDDDEKANWRD